MRNLLSNHNHKQTAVMSPSRLFDCMKPSRPVLPGGEPQDFGDEAGRQAVDAGLRWRPTQGPVRAAQLRFLLLLPELPAVERFQQLHGFNLDFILVSSLLFLLRTSNVFYVLLLLESPMEIHFHSVYSLLPGAL